VITIRPVDSDLGRAAWRQVRLEVLPNERAASVEEMRRSERPDQVLLLADVDGAVAGSGIAGRSDLAGAGFVAPRVRPDARRQGVGTELLARLADHVASLGFDVASADVEDPGSLAFAERFGFREVDRQVEQVRPIETEPYPTVPAGVRVVPVAERPELWRVPYEQVAVEALQDMAVVAPMVVSPAEWDRDWISDPAAMFLAVAGEDVVGCAGLMLDTDRPERAELAFTAVRRDWRGRGIASTLKRWTHAWAADHGIQELYTWTQRGNDDMRRLNAHLGYRTRTESITVRAQLPLAF